MAEDTEEIKILKGTSEALSHASYCAITGMRPNTATIQGPWDKLRALIEKLSPSFSFIEEKQATLLFTTPEMVNEVAQLRAQNAQLLKAAEFALRLFKLQQETGSYTVPPRMDSDSMRQLIEAIEAARAATTQETTTT